MRVLGLDPGSRRTGFGVVDRSGNVFQCVSHGTATAAARMPLAQRLHRIVEQVGVVMDEFGPDVVAVEEAFYHESVRSTLVLGHVRGALLVAAVQRGFEVAEYTPREVKMSVAGTGAGSKEQVAFMVRRMLGVRGPLGPDASDALAIALCHHHRARRPGPARAVTAASQRLAALMATRGRR